MGPNSDVDPASPQLLPQFLNQVNGTTSQFEDGAATIISGLSACLTSIKHAQDDGILLYNAYRCEQEKVVYLTEDNKKLRCKNWELEQQIKSSQYYFYQTLAYYPGSSGPGAVQARPWSQWERTAGFYPDQASMAYPGHYSVGDFQGHSAAPLKGHGEPAIPPNAGCPYPSQKGYISTAPPKYSPPTSCGVGTEPSRSNTTLLDLASAALSYDNSGYIKRSSSMRP
ncbi:hypothetical protein BDV35DRAFT_374382 [Aspergillus flavus]|uniref:Uncharacterized protein n=1 Tax=Aspergillus flavus TaxID=5059 RepID=A0A5N6GG68_ASPFL|nr:hypothetical protein BDV35DRAFT_374382 [Aspergillus flavus]GMG03973.1 unnamed protein product [Aspergillus oryzae]